MNRFKVAVIGGGPAGSFAAYCLAKKGIDVVLFEKEKMPRIKPCGGAISIKGLNLLKREGINIPSNLIEREIFGLNIKNQDGEDFDIASDKKLAILTIRKNFDHFLFQAAQEKGAKTYEGVRIDKIIDEQNHIRIITENGESFFCIFLIGADGVNGIVAKELGFRKKWEKNQVKITIEYEPEIPEKTIEEKYGNSKKIFIEFIEDANGYYWVFPKKRHISIGLGGEVAKIRKMKEKFNDYFLKDKELFQKPIHTRSWIVPIGGYKHRISSSSSVLIGDAAGFVDSFLSEGVQYALLSAHIAVEEINKLILKNPKEISLEKYEQRCNKEILNNLKYSLYFSRVFNLRLGFFLDLFEIDKKLGFDYTKIILGESSYKEFFIKMLFRFPILLLKYLYFKLRKS
ncbi:MAG: NAD(P)/FAD-dependent oxidoreductase [Candidatus Ranarchaeia archaeon]